MSWLCGVYLWLQTGIRADAVIHIGAHGTLEWLPGKAVALSSTCWPEVLTGHLPVIYPFVINDPGEAAQAKRRIGALTLGHIPPPCALHLRRRNSAILRRFWMNFPMLMDLIQNGGKG